jgi:hypothetical protein
MGNRNLAAKYRGEAVRLLSQLKMGIQPFISRMFPDGTQLQILRGPVNDIVNVTSPFGGVKAIEVLIVKKKVLFLVNSTNYAAWKISDRGETLTPFFVNMHKAATLFAVSHFPSTCKSNTGLTRHRYSTQYSGITITDLFGCSGMRYGKRDLSCGITFGLRNCYTGSIFNASIAYLSYGNAYICSGRYDTYKDESTGDTITDLEVWNSNIKYKVNDVEVVGPAINTDGLYAVLDINGSCITLMDDNSDFSTSTETDYCLYYPIYIGGDEIRQVAVRVSGYEASSLTGSMKLMVAGITVESGVGTTTYSIWGNIGWRQTPHSCKEPTRECVGPWYMRTPPGMIEGRWVTQNVSSTTIRCLDYDIKGEDFILFYRIHESYSAYSDCQCGASNAGTDYDVSRWCPDDESHTLALGPDPIYSGTIYSGVGITRYKIAYYLNGSLSYVNIASFFNSSSKQTIEDGVVVSTDLNYANGTMPDGISCYIDNEYITYTYKILTYNSGVFEFTSRVIGLVNIKTGNLYSHTVDDALLGDLYKDYFDETVNSAIGVHVKEVTI